MQNIIRAIDALNEKTGLYSSYLILPLVGAVIYEVFMRYVFNAPTSWGFEMTTFLYGMHYMLNIVTGPDNFPSAVLIRALESLPAHDSNQKFILSGPARLTKQLAIDKSFNTLPAFTKKHGLWLESRDEEIKPSQIVKTTRIGIDYAKEYKDKKWRYYLKNNPFISKK